MIVDFSDAHKDPFLKLNEEFVHWLSPLDGAGLDYILSKASYRRAFIDPESGQLFGALLAYSHDVDYPDHWNIAWLSERLDRFFYIDRVVISAEAQGQGVGYQLYQDLALFAHGEGFETLACEVNTIPDNPGSHAFHLRAGFEPLGEQNIPEKGKAVRYYAKALN